VILVYPQPNPLPSSQPTAPTLDGAPTDLGVAESQPEIQHVEPQVLKVIKKYDIELLCLQHNPVSNCLTPGLTTVADVHV